MVARNVDCEGDAAIKKKTEGQKSGGENVRIGEESVSHGLVDEFGDKDDGSDDAGDEADGADEDVEVGEAHGGAVGLGEAEETEEDDQEDTDTNNQVDSDKTHH